MKIQALTILLLFVNIHSFNAKDKISFQLQKSQRAIKVISGDINQKYSAHFIVFKDNKERNYGIKSFFIDEQNNVKPLQIIEFDSQPNIESYHYSEKTKTLTLITKSDKKSLKISDFYINNNIIDSYNINSENSYLMVRLSGKSILITTLINEKKLNIKTIKNSYDFYDFVYDFNKEFEEEFDIIFSNKPEFINQNEFVKNGSISTSKLYVIDDQLMFDYTSKSKYISLQINPDSYKLPIVVKAALNDPNKIKDINSYVFGDNFFLFINYNEDLKIETYDNLTGQLLDQKNISENLKNSVPYADIQYYIKKTKKYRFKITGTVNSTINKNRMLVTLDYVDKNNYKYYHDWWFHHWMMDQQMHMMNNSNSFRGPHPADFDFVFPSIKLNEKTKTIQFEVDNDFNFYPKTEKTKYKNAHKEYYIKKIDKRNDVTQVSVAFTRSSIRYLFYSKKTESFHIKAEAYVF